MAITLLTAARSGQILIMRRKPTDTVHLVLWDPRRATFAHGSWFRGAIQQDRCDLSEDGQWLLYAARGNQPPHFWSGLSPVPRLGFDLRWDLGVNWDYYGRLSGGGGYFTGPKRYVACTTYAAEHGLPPNKPRGGPWVREEGVHAAHPLLPPPFAARLHRDGWTLCLPPDTPELWPHQDGALDALYDTLRDAPSAHHVVAGRHLSLSVLHHPAHGRRYLYYCKEEPARFDADVRSVVPYEDGVAVGRSDAVYTHRGADWSPELVLDLSDSRPPW